MRALFAKPDGERPFPYHLIAPYPDHVIFCLLGMFQIVKSAKSLLICRVDT